MRAWAFILIALFAAESAAQGYIVPSRRRAPSGPWDPTMCSTSLAFLYDVGGFDENASLAGFWDDTSGNNRDATAPGVNDGSEITVSGVLVWDTGGVSTEYLQTGSITALSQPNTVFGVFHYDVAAAQDFVTDGIGISNRHAMRIRNDGANDDFNVYGGANIDDGISDTSWHYFVALYDNTSGLIRIDGSETTGTVGTQTLTGLTIGSDYNGGAQTMNGQIATIGVYDGDATAACLSNLETWLAAIKTDLTD